MSNDERLRTTLASQLDSGAAHATFDRAVDGVPPEHYGARPEGFPHSLWELLEHIRIAQRDVLDYCSEGEYRHMQWPDAYWPPAPAPSNTEEWVNSIAAYRSDRDELKRIAQDADPFATVPHSDEHTYLRELLLIADHTSYHVGQMVLVRKALGGWE